MANSNIDLINGLDKIRMSNLYVHNDVLNGVCFTNEKLNKRKVYLVETLAVVNALVDRGTMLLYGGHGGGKTTLAKYLGQIFYRFSKDEIEDCILRGHPQLTEEKILGSLDIAQLTGRKDLNKKQNIDVIWNEFVDSQWKIIDELNRLSPYAQNILLSLLAESSVKYHNESKRLPNFSLYATMNPKDEGNFIMSLPFLDRFALALPITMPNYESLSTIGKKDKSSKQEDLSTYLKDFDLKDVQDEVRNIKYSEEAELFINFIISSYRLCDRISKESNESTSVDKELCKGCHFNAPEKVCNKIIHPLSVRVKEDLYRYGKALVWFLGDSEVEPYHIATIAPYMIWHRSSLGKRFKSKFSDEQSDSNLFTTNIDLDATKKIISQIEAEFDGIKEMLKKLDQIKKGKLSEKEFNEFVFEAKDANNNFLLIQKEIIPTLENDYSPVYKQIVEYNNKIDTLKDIEKLKKLKDELSFKYDIPNRHFLAESIEKKIRSIGIQDLREETFKISMKFFIENVQRKCPEFAGKIKQRYPQFPDTFSPAIRKPESLSQIEDSDFDLTMEYMTKGGDLRFKYRGKQDTAVYQYLNGNNVN
mgnify:CR=1 FL=1